MPSAPATPAAVRRALRGLGWALLWGAAIGGVALSVAALLAALPVTRPFAAATLVRWADEAVAGRLELDGIGVLARGGVELRGLRVFDPDGRPVLGVERARVFFHAFGIVERELGVTLELDGVEVDAAQRGEDGELALARAFAPARRAPPRPGRTAVERPAGAGEVAREAVGWTLRVARLSMSRGHVVAEGLEGEPLDLTGVTLDARGLWAARGAWIEARLAGVLEAPVKAPVTLELRAMRDHDRVELQRLAASVGDDWLEAVGEGDLARRSGRLAVTRLGLSAREAGALAPAAQLAGGLSGTIYAESDGEVATASLVVAPAKEEAGGRAELALAARQPPGPRAWGVTADVDRLDPSRLSLLAPPGRVTLHGRGAWRGSKLSELAGQLDLKVERSRLRGGEVGPIEIAATAGGGRLEVARLDARAPGGSVSGRLRWGARSEVSGALSVTAGDLGLLERNLAAVLGRKVPHLEGSGRASVALSGTTKAPQLVANVDAGRIAVGSAVAEGAHLRVSVAGPLATISGEVQGRLARARVGPLAFRAVELDAALGKEEASLSFTANAPQLGTDLVRATLRGRFGPERRFIDLGEALVAWPGTRLTLERPARIDLATPAVSRLALAAGAQRVEVDGGLRRGGKLEGRLRLVGIDLARLPRGLLPADAAPEGILTLDALASGTAEAPRIDATVGVTGASIFQVGGLRLRGKIAWDGEAERVGADLGLVREAGGSIDVSLDLPIARARARAHEVLRVEVRGKDVPLDELVWLAGSYALVSGDVDVTIGITGSVGAPVLHASAEARNGTWDDLEKLGLAVTLDASGGRLKASGSGTLGGAAAAALEAELALELAKLPSRPRETIAAARRGPLTLALRAPGIALERLAGKLGLPADLDGRLAVEASLGGSVAVPRGTARFSIDDGAGWGARRVGVRLDAALAPERTGGTMELRFAGSPAVRLVGAIELPLERMLDRRALAAAPVRLDATVSRSELAAWGGALIALRGVVQGAGSLRGTPGAPQGELAISAAGVVVEGRPLGDVSLKARHDARRSTVGLELRPPAGGSLMADLVVEQPLGVGAAAGPLLSAPSELRVRAEKLDLAFLPALAPGVVRSAAGAANADLAAAGPLGELRPRGSFRVAKGRLALAELGEWTDVTIEAELGVESAALRRFDVRKGSGRLSLRGSLEGLGRAEPAELEARLETKDFGVERAGMELARFDLVAEGRGQLTREGLTLGVVIPQAEIKLPKRIPRTLQETGTRKDITVGRPRPQRPRRSARAAPAGETEAGPAAPAEPFRTVIHVVAPRRLRVRADQPRIDVELKADAIFAFAGAREEATGSIEAIRGQAEPIGGRVFVLERGKVTFNGGPLATGGIDLVARYDNPTAVVRATVGGTLRKPVLHLSSEPPMEEARIAMLVATGRTEVKAGAGGVNSLAAGEAGLAAAGAVAMGVFKDLLSNKLPVDSVSLDSTAVSAGKYLTDRVYVGYIRRFDAKPEKGENPDEVRVEYQLAPGWQVETRYGTGQSGGANLVWTRNY